MTTVAPVSGPLAPVGAPPPTSGTPAVTTSSLLPPPVAENPDDLTALLLTQVQDRRINSQDAMRRVGVARERGRQLLEEARRSLERAARAERRERKRHRTGRLFVGIAKVAAIVASVAATVVSFGSATPLTALAIAGVVMSMSGQVLGETRALQALGMNDRAASACTFGLSVVGTVMSAGAGAAGAMGSAADGASATCDAAAAAGTVARGVEGGAKAAAAVCEERAAHCQEVGANAETDAVAANQREDRMQAMILRLIEELKTAEASADRVTETLASTIDTKMRTVAVAGGITWNG